MPEIIQRQGNPTREQLFELFENITFMDYSPYFYESPKTIAEVLRLLKIKGRGTINRQLKIFQQDGGYDPNYIKTEASWKPPQKKLLFTHNLVADFIIFHAEAMGQKIELPEQERGLLLEFMDLPGVNLVLRKNTREWLDPLCRLSVSMIFFMHYRGEVGTKNVLISRLSQRVKSLSAFEHLTQQEQEAYFQDLQRFNQERGPQIYPLAVKLVNLGIPISFTSKDVCLLSRGAMEAAKWGAEIIFDVWKKVDPSYGRKLRKNLPAVTSLLKDQGIEIDFEKEKKYRDFKKEKKYRRW
jgi:hypothetical protein